MATKIMIIPAKDFLEVTADGIINITTSRQLLADIAKAEHPPVDYELLVDFRVGGVSDKLGGAGKTGIEEPYAKTTAT
jgi:hypothetical protein